MPDLDGGQLPMADLAKSKAYFEDLYKIFKLKIVANGAKNPLLLLPLPEIPRQRMSARLHAHGLQI
jgi:hypothetical protein